MQYVCWAQSMDSDNPWMELRKAWIHASRGQSIDCSTNSARASAIAQNSECILMHTRGIERGDSEFWRSANCDTLQERRPWLTEKRSRTTSGILSYNRRHVHRILPVSWPIRIRAHNATRSRAQHRPATPGPRSFRERATALANPRYVQFNPWIA